MVNEKLQLWMEIRNGRRKFEMVDRNLEIWNGRWKLGMVGENLEW